MAGRLSRLDVWPWKLGVAADRIEPGKPQQDVRHKRLHRMLKAETACPPYPDRSRQQHRFDRLRKEYSHDGPHEALGQRPTAEGYMRAVRPYPKQVPEPEHLGH